MHGHGFALMYLASVYGMESNPSMRKRTAEAVKKGIDLTARGRSPDGGWYYTPGCRRRRLGHGDAGAGLAGGAERRLSRPQAARSKTPSTTSSGAARPRGASCYSLQLRRRPAAGDFGRRRGHALQRRRIRRAGRRSAAWTMCRRNSSLHDGWSKGGGHDFYTHLYASQAFYMAGRQILGRLLSPHARPLVEDARQGRRLLERRRHRPGLRHGDRPDHSAASVQIFTRLSTLNARELASERCKH